mmetsp:Transcript_15308/g.39796  ORF Transcript_15308/g.39796 Transcript_15308/m.39796 type:complete len:280 (-) Transcript_15308:898-1737(-)
MLALPALVRLGLVERLGELPLPLPPPPAAVPLADWWRNCSTAGKPCAASAFLPLPPSVVPLPALGLSGDEAPPPQLPALRLPGDKAPSGASSALPEPDDPQRALAAKCTVRSSAGAPGSAPLPPAAAGSERVESGAFPYAAIRYSSVSALPAAKSAAIVRISSRSASGLIWAESASSKSFISPLDALRRRKSCSSHLRERSFSTVNVFASFSLLTSLHHGKNSTKEMWPLWSASSRATASRSSVRVSSMPMCARMASSSVLEMVPEPSVSKEANTLRTS